VRAYLKVWRGSIRACTSRPSTRPALLTVRAEREDGVTARSSPSVLLDGNTPQLIAHEEHDRVKGQGPEKATTPADHLVGASKHHTSPFLTTHKCLLPSSLHYTTHYKHQQQQQQLVVEIDRQPAAKNTSPFPLLPRSPLLQLTQLSRAYTTVPSRPVVDPHHRYSIF
jgi:hypothetical protein